MSAGLHASGVCVSAGGRLILDRVDIAVPPGRLIAVVGPNGAGKSTLLKVLAGELVPRSGLVTLNGKPMTAWSPEERALQRAVLPQAPELAFSFRTQDVVEMGRYPHRGRATREQDRLAVAEAMGATETWALAGRECRSLSGGERHRTHFARVLAQIWSPLPDGRSRVLLLDEPTASLDLFHQHAVLSKARALADRGVAVLAVLHDLNLAAAFADDIAVLADGRIDAVGMPREVLTSDRLTRIWRVECDIVVDEAGRVQVHVRRRTSRGQQLSFPGSGTCEVI